MQLVIQSMQHVCLRVSVYFSGANSLESLWGSRVRQAREEGTERTQEDLIRLRWAPHKLGFRTLGTPISWIGWVSIKGP